MPIKNKIIDSIFAHKNNAPWLVKTGNWILRYLYVLGRDLARGQLTLRAMSLVYTTLMALVPMVAVGFSVLKAFGVHVKQLEPLLLQFLEPMGAQGKEITSNIIGFIDKVNISVLGAVGLLFLLYNAISLVQKIETTFNYIWHLRRSRSIGRRIADYLTALLVGPTMLFFALGISASILGASIVNHASHIEVIAYGVSQLKKLMPYFIMIGAFSFFYIFIPNTKVKWMPGVVAGAVAGILWQSIGWLFGKFVVSSTDSSTYAIYSGFAILILFMLWMYISWLILLIGGSLAFYLQHPEYVVPTGEIDNNSTWELQRISLALVAQVVAQFYAGEKLTNPEYLSKKYAVGIYTLDMLIVALEAAHILATDEEGALLLACPAEQTSVLKVLDCVYHLNANVHQPITISGQIGNNINQIESKMQKLMQNQFADLTLKDLALKTI